MRRYPISVCGAHALGWITVQATSYQITQGQPRNFESSAGVDCSFRGQCGTPLTYQHAHRPGEIDVTIGSLDHPEQAAPVDRACLIDELHVAISPVVLGVGERLFVGIDMCALGYKCGQSVASEKATPVALRCQR